MAEDRVRNHTRRGTRGHKRPVEQRREPQPPQDQGTKTTQIRLDLDYLASTYGITFLDFTDILWTKTGKPLLVLRGRRKK